MKAKIIILTLAVLASVLVAGCSDDRYSVSDEHCKPEYWQKLADNSGRTALIEACMESSMTRGNYNMPTPETF